MKNAANGLLIGKTDKGGGDGIIIETPEGKIRAGGGEIIINEESSKKHCELLSEINQDGGGVAIPCDEQKNANTGRFDDGGQIPDFESEINRLSNDYYRLKQANGDRGRIAMLKKQIEELKTNQKNYQMKKMPANIENFLNKFPDDAKSWGQATDEIRDLARMAREYYNGITLDVLNDDSSALQPLNFCEFNTPSEWNTNAKKFIRETYEKMNDQTKQQFIERFNDSFGNYKSFSNGGTVNQPEFHYLSIGNILKDRFGKYARITKHSKDGIFVVEHSEFPISTTESEIAFPHLCTMMDNGLATIEGKSYNKDDEAHRFLLRKEIAVIQLLLDVAEHGAMITKIQSECMEYREKTKATIDGMLAMNGENAKSAESIWSEWDEQQRNHFLVDNGFSQGAIDRYIKKQYTQLPIKVRAAVNRHITGGDYAKGGKTTAAQYDKKGALKLTQQESDKYDQLMGDFLNDGLSESKADKEAVVVLKQEFPRLNDLLNNKKIKISTEIA